MRAYPAPRCALALLRGHGGIVLRLIVDYAGMVREWQLRSACEAPRIFLARGSENFFV